MEYSILEKLYKGEIAPCENFETVLLEYRKKKKIAYQSYEDFINKLPKDLQIEFEAVMDDFFEQTPYEFEQAFLDGFRLGVKMMAEVYI